MRKNEKESNLDRAIEVYGDSIHSGKEVDFDANRPLSELLVLNSGPKIYCTVVPFTCI